MPYYTAEAPDSDNLETRSVFVFRLRPVGVVEKRERDLSVKTERPAGPISLLVEPEAVESAVFEHPGSQASTSVRVESGLVKRFRAHLESKGHEVKRWRLAPLGELTYLYTDIFDVTENELYEAKGSAVRSSVRQAVGQLLDYKRLIQLQDVKLSVLLPVKPSIDIQEFIRSCEMSCVWENETGEFEVLSKE